MPQPKHKKIAYLFGAGATHAELTMLEKTFLEEKNGLLTKDVSSRVVEKARRNKAYMEDISMVQSTRGSLENSKIDEWADKTSRLKELVRKDIESILTAARKRLFYLHKALFEFHEQRNTKLREKLIGVISLNYDDVLDQAFKEFHGEPNYCFTLEEDGPSAEKIPLLKLHGSFNWSGKSIRGRNRTIEIIPLGANKNYLHVPYGFIWSRALEILVECDTLRVIGCSLSPNDSHLIDLLFKAHLEKGKAFEIEIISSENGGEQIQRNYGFFPKIKKLTEIESALIPDPTPMNPFKTWLFYKFHNTYKKGLPRTKYLSKVTI